MAQLAHLGLGHRQRARRHAHAAGRSTGRGGVAQPRRRATRRWARTSDSLPSSSSASSSIGLDDRAAGDGGEDLFEALGPVALEQLRTARPARPAVRGRSRRGGRSGARPPPSGGWSRGSSCPPARRSASRRSHTILRAVGSRPDRGLVQEQHRRAVEQRGGDLQAAQHPARERARKPVEHRLELHRLDHLLRSARAARAAARRSRGRRSRDSHTP